MLGWFEIVFYQNFCGMMDWLLELQRFVVDLKQTLLGSHSIFCYDSINVVAFTRTVDVSSQTVNCPGASTEYPTTAVPTSA